ncbi:MAG: cell wall hydrolase [Rhodanobacteraceae bacterium]|nr:cell wall hydrolase [Rhodanobacteraceae bacterium]MBK7042536.1 cell wall hydrolase [Rhodanobacteraceae bacterium]MBP9154734.1 cell wall hydrolase [Xanthomonadales bacterium]HQW81069.1 cell wall hydrolase [Pseudomonadota bacterium]
MTLATLLMIANWLPQPIADQTCLTATLYLEARDQPVLGQVAIAEVALRRRASKPPENLCGVLMAPKQFALSIVSPRFQLRNIGAWNRAWRIAGTTMTRWAISGEHGSVVPAADHFFAYQRVTPAWAAHGEQVALIGDHAFYRLTL